MVVDAIVVVVDIVVVADGGGVVVVSYPCRRQRISIVGGSGDWCVSVLGSEVLPLPNTSTMSEQTLKIREKRTDPGDHSRTGTIYPATVAKGVEQGIVREGHVHRLAVR